MLPDHLADLAIAGMATDRLLELAGGDVDAVQQQRAARTEAAGRQVVQAQEGFDRCLARAQHHHDGPRLHRADDVDAGRGSRTTELAQVEAALLGRPVRTQIVGKPHRGAA